MWKENNFLIWSDHVDWLYLFITCSQETLCLAGVHASLWMQLSLGFWTSYLRNSSSSVFPQKRSFPVVLSGSFQSRMNGSFCNTTKLPLSVSTVHLLLETSQAGIMQEKWVTEIYWCQFWFCIHNVFYCYF